MVFRPWDCSKRPDFLVRSYVIQKKVQVRSYITWYSGTGTFLYSVVFRPWDCSKRPDFLVRSYVIQKKVQVCSYITWYSGLGTVQNALSFTPWQTFHSNTNSSSLGRIQSRCNHCAKTIHSHGTPVTHIHRGP